MVYRSRRFKRRKKFYRRRRMSRRKKISYRVKKYVKKIAGGEMKYRFFENV